MTQAYLIVLIDKKHGHLYYYTAASQQLEPFEEINDDVPRPAKGASWKGLADDKVARHIGVHIHEHWKHILERIEPLLRTKPQVSVLLGGPEEDVQAFSAILPQPLQNRIIGTIHPSHYAGLNQLKEQIQTAIHATTRRTIETFLAEVSQQTHPSGRAVIGREAVCEALNLHQVEKLLIDPTQAYPGFVCSTGEAVSTLQSTCFHCLQPMAAIDDLRPALEQLAGQAQTRILYLPLETVLPEAAAGLVGMKRYVD